MTRSTTLAASPTPSCHHASVEEYTHFVQSSTESLTYRDGLLQHRKRFVACYPDLRDWFAAPLVERFESIGYAYAGKKTPYSSVVFTQVHHYLKFLALRGYAPLDWDWLIALRHIHLDKMLHHPTFASNVSSLAQEAIALGYDRRVVQQMLLWSVHRIFLHKGITQVEQITVADLTEFALALDRFGHRPDVALFSDSAEHYDQRRRTLYLGSLQLLQNILYHRGQIHVEPRRFGRQQAPRTVARPRMEATIERYLATRRFTHAPGTVRNFEKVLRHFAHWLLHTYPTLEAFADVTREHLLEYANALNTMKGERTQQPFAATTKYGMLSYLAQFFQEVAFWGWEDVPPVPLLRHGDLPKLPQRVPRYIPEHQLDQLMPAIRALECPYQRAALLIARWSGARRDEIQRLSFDCLDSYPDGTPRLRIPAGKTKQERLVPLNQEAADAIRVVQTLRKGERGLRDRQTGVETRYLFMHFGKPISIHYLFESPLRKVCTTAGLLTPDNKATVTAHRFRHTVGTQLAKKGARLRTIQKILGHESAGMSMVYIGITDEEVRQDYQAVLGSGAVIAGPGAELVRSGELGQSEIGWIKENFFKTELELGRCLRLPQEGPCECDLYLTCAKFVTSPEYVPRLRRRRRLEQELVEDAAAHGWQREVERHQCTIRRLEQLLTDLGESLDGALAMD
jgi:site-specific recombinase XerD